MKKVNHGNVINKVLPYLKGLFNRRIVTFIIIVTFITLLPILLPFFLIWRESVTHNYESTIAIILLVLVFIIFYFYNTLASKLTGEDSKTFRNSFKSSLLGTLGALTVGLFLLLLVQIYTTTVQTNKIILKLNEAKMLMSMHGGYEYALSICEEYNNNEYVTNSDLLNGTLRYIEGKCNYELALKKDDEKYLSRSMVSSAMAELSFHRATDKENALKARNLVGLSYIALSEFNSKKGNLEAAKTIFTESYESLNIDIRNRRPVTEEEFNTFMYLGDTYIEMAKIEEKEKNLRQAEKIVKEGYLLSVNETKMNMDFAFLFLTRLSSINKSYLSIRESKERRNKLNQYQNDELQLLKHVTKQDILPITSDLKASFELVLTEDVVALAEDVVANKEAIRKYISKSISLEENSLGIDLLMERPINKARTQMRLGIEYLVLSKLEEPIKNLNKAIEAENEALVVFTQGKHPYLYADATSDLGQIYLEMFLETKDESYINTAFKLFENALRVYTPEKYPYLYADLVENMGKAYYQRYRQFRNEEDLTMAKDYLAKSMRIYNQRDFPITYARLLRELESF